MLSAACGSTGISTTPDAPTVTVTVTQPAQSPNEAFPSTEPTTTPNSPVPSTPAIATVGDTITLKGQQNADVMAVTLVKVDPAATSTDQFLTPDAGDKYLAVQFRLENKGQNAYDDSPSNGAVVVDDQGQRFDATFMSKISSGPVMPANVKIAPGGKALGWVVFEVPSTFKAAKVQFSLSSGFGNTGQWDITS
jgi:hypothetical protein